jgi:hypothetical protein
MGGPLIIQTSPYRTGSTLLVNALYGMIPSICDKEITMLNDKYWRNKFNGTKAMVVKHHNLHIDKLIKQYKKHTLFFVCSERKDINRLIDEKYKNMDNIIVFSYEELNETEDNPLTTIIDTIYNKFKNMLDIELDKDSSLKRIQKMNERYLEIKDEPFTYVDTFYHIHGSHRNRPK